jgi:MFS family permease
MITPASTAVKRSVGFLVGMSTLMLGANLVWVSYNTILLPTLVEKVVTQSKGLVVGLIGFFGTVLAILVSILWGVISDHTSSKLGKRSPAILVGALVALPLIGLPALILFPPLRAILFPLALPIIIISYFGMQFSTNVGNGAWWPLLVDVVPENQRGLASGIQGFLTLVGAAIGILVVTGLNQNGQTGTALLLIGGVFALTGVINTWVIHGKDKPADTSQHISIWNAMADMFKVRTRVVVFFWLVLALLLANMGINSLQFFARYFFQVYFPAISPDAAFRTMGGISLVVTMLAAVGSGFLSDKIGRRSMIFWAMIVCAVCTLLMGFTSNFFLFLVFTALRSISTGPIMATAPALASDLAPKDEAGRYMAYNNLSTGLSGALSSLIFGVLLVNLTRTTFMYLFIISAILFLVGGIVFSTKVSQKALDARFEAVVEEMEGLA